ncbi:MAG TPA: hypothetical protein VHM02_12760 [Thermoanaerobaculia bacterium]|nr:hypothetical protein [Thermoanaerobaculia bacterium]
MRHPSVALTASLLVLSLAVPAAALEVGSIATSRVGDWTLDGFEMQSTRAKLENAVNFGTGGTIPEGIDVTDVSAPLTETLLAQFDVFFVGYVPDGTLSAAELSALENWVADGGLLIATCDDTGHDAVCNELGVTLGAVSVEPAGPAAGFETHPLFDGPFGQAQALGLFGNQGSFAALGGAVVLAEDAGGLPVIAIDDHGEGAVLFLADVDLISDNNLTAGADFDFGHDNDALLGNLFAALADLACPADALCLQGGRFEVRAFWETASDSGFGQPVQLTSDSGYFWFFDAANIEVVAKLLAACPVNDRFWFFAAGLTNVEVTLEVTDTSVPRTNTYFNPQGTAFQPIQDTAAFDTCP